MIEAPERTTIDVILDRELRKRLEQAAADNERSVGAEVRVALRRHLAADHEQEEPMAFPGRKELAAADPYAGVARASRSPPTSAVTALSTTERRMARTRRRS